MWRVIIPLVVVAVWLGLSSIGGPYFGRISEVSNNDMTLFLPRSAESTKVNNELVKFRDGRTLPVIAVFLADGQITSGQIDSINNSSAAMKQTHLVQGDVSPPIVSSDRQSAYVVVPLDSSVELKTAIPKLRSAVAESNASSGLSYKFTGPAMFAESLISAFAGIDGVLLLVALSVVFAILLFVYRSPILPVVTLLGAMFALSVAILLVWWLAKAGVIELNGQVQGILFILVIGATTDYSLLYIARYREEFIRLGDRWNATKVAWKASWEPIVAAGGTVTLGLLCLLVSDLGSNKALGPVGGIGIILAVVSALTFLPSILLLFGGKAFWPRTPKKLATKNIDYHQAHPAWSKVGRLVGRYPRRLWVGLTVLLLAACLLVLQLKANGVAQSDFVLGASEARDGQALLDQHFPGGSGSPAYILAPQQNQDQVVAILDQDTGVAGVSLATDSSRLPNLPVGVSASKIPGAATLFADVQPKIVDGEVLLQATLTDPADSLAARHTIERLRAEIQNGYPTVNIGGISAVQLDTGVAAEHDLRLIIPLILVVITIILMLLLRSIVAPLVLLMTTLLSFGATLGIAALLFNNVWHYPGADPSVVIYGFVFLVALGIDYNIFLMTRVREEVAKNGLRQGTIKALVVTGGVISSAGIVLASTFAALYVIPILFLAQIAFIVAFGVLLDTLVVRSLLVPSLTLEAGRFMWWPSRLFKKLIHK